MVYCDRQGKTHKTVMAFNELRKFLKQYVSSFYSFFILIRISKSQISLIPFYFDPFYSIIFLVPFYFKPILFFFALQFHHTHLLLSQFLILTRFYSITFYLNRFYHDQRNSDSEIFSIIDRVLHSFRRVLRYAHHQRAILEEGSRFHVHEFTGLRAKSVGENENFQGNP